MAGAAEEPLREVQGEAEAQRLLQALSRDRPHSIHIMNNIQTIMHYQKAGLLKEGVEPPMPRCAVYRYRDDGDSSDGEATAVTVTKVEPHNNIVCVHTTDATGAALRRVLADSSVFPWAEETLFDSVHERCVPALLEETRRHADPARAPELYPTDKMVLSKEDAARLDTRPPPGYVVLPLEAKHDVPVEATWYIGNATPGARDWIRSTLVRNPGLSWGIFPEDDTEGWPAAHILGDIGGHLRILWTSEDHRRKGLGALVTAVASKALAERGQDPHANIVYPNPGSDATFKKLGFKRVCECVFVWYKAPLSSA